MKSERYKFPMAQVKTEGSPTYWESIVGGLPDVREVITWRDLLDVELKKQNDHSSVTLVGDLDKDADYGQTAWTVWTKGRVYFPAGYDGRFWVASVPRNPCVECVKAVGGGIS